MYVQYNFYLHLKKCFKKLCKFSIEKRYFISSEEAILYLDIKFALSSLKTFAGLYLTVLNVCFVTEKGLMVHTD